MKFNKLIPELSVTDIQKSKHFYVDILNFKIKYERKENKFIFLTYQGSQIMIEEINDNKEQLYELVNEYQDIYVKISKLAEINELEDNYLYDIVSLTEKLIDVVAKGKENIRREVNNMGGNVLKLDREKN